MTSTPLPSAVASPQPPPGAPERPPKLSGAKSIGKKRKLGPTSASELTPLADHFLLDDPERAEIPARVSAEAQPAPRERLSTNPTGGGTAPVG